MVTSSTITFTDPCLNPYTYTAVGQPNFADDDYTDTTQTFNLAEFSITPARCLDRITYTCSVTGPDGSTDFTAEFCDSFNGNK